jgi:hypothetical protein
MPWNWSRLSCADLRKRQTNTQVFMKGGRMNSTVLVDLSPEEMCECSGGAVPFYCWGGGVMTVLGFAAMNAMAATAGLWFIYNYC